VAATTISNNNNNSINPKTSFTPRYSTINKLLTNNNSNKNLSGTDQLETDVTFRPSETKESDNINEEELKINKEKVKRSQK
jgi:hypothetical protein